MKYIKLLGLIWVLTLPTALLSQEKISKGVMFSIDALPSSGVSTFFAGRGFTETQIEKYANSCVFSTILRNDAAKGSIHFLRKDWTATYQNKEYHIKPTSYWVDLFNNLNVKLPQKIAFELGQIPEEQTYDPIGDWNEGMISFDLPRDITVDITVRYDIKGEKYEIKVPNVKCVK